MKKITSENEITFRIDGNTVLEINSEGCLVDDAAAAIVSERLGGQVRIEDVDAEEAAALAGAGAGDANIPAGPTVPTKKMTRDALDELAKSEGVTDEELDAAATKADAVALILKHREDVAAAGAGAGDANTTA